MTDLVTNYLIEERDKTKYIVDSVVEMEINYLFTNDREYLDNFTSFIPKHRKQQFQQQQQGNNMNNSNSTNNLNKDGPGQKSQENINEPKPLQQGEAKKLFIKEIRNRIEAYFKLIVRNLRDMIPKIMGNKNAQKIIRRDPDLMTVMQININDSDITPSKDTKKKEEKKEPEKPAPAKGKKNLGNLFG